MPTTTGRSRTLMSLLCCCAGVACASNTRFSDAGAPGPTTALQRVRTWAVQLQGIDQPRAAARLVAAPVDMLVIEPTRSVRGRADFAMADLVGQLQQPVDGGERRLCLAYLNVGQAEDYRDYWMSGWRRPTAGESGDPSFLVSVDPDGWQGNYPVAFWDPGWQQVLWGHRDAPLDQILDDGFDGVYLDWILGYAEPAVVAAAAQAGIDPAEAMVALLGGLRSYARARRPGFLMVAQNGVELADRAPGFLSSIDGFAHEDLSYHGSAAARWGDAEAGGLPAPVEGPWSTEELARRLGRVGARGLPVFTLDYAVEPDHIARAQRASRALGFVPFVSRTPLDRLPVHVFATP